MPEIHCGSGLGLSLLGSVRATGASGTMILLVVLDSAASFVTGAICLSGPGEVVPGDDMALVFSRASLVSMSQQLKSVEELWGGIITLCNGNVGSDKVGTNELLMFTLGPVHGGLNIGADGFFLQRGRIRNRKLQARARRINTRASPANPEPCESLLDTCILLDCRSREEGRYVAASCSFLIGSSFYG